jgi:hypothetical protein
MKTAPIGLGAYFAYQVGIWTTAICAYAKPLGLYYGVCAFTLLYFLVCTPLAGGKLGFKNILDK